MAILQLPERPEQWHGQARSTYRGTAGGRAEQDISLNDSLQKRRSFDLPLTLQPEKVLGFKLISLELYWLVYVLCPNVSQLPIAGNVD